MAQMIAKQVRMMAEEGKLTEEGLTDLMKGLHAGKGYHTNLYLLVTRLKAAGYLPERLTP